jgi:hypothetical protein
MKTVNQRLRNSTKWALGICLCVLIASALRALACYLPVDEGPCGPTESASCANGCIGILYSPNNSFCDSRDGESGGTDCHVSNVPCEETEYFYEEEYDIHGQCTGCGFCLGWEDMGSTSLAHIAVVTGSCSVGG